MCGPPGRMKVHENPNCPHCGSKTQKSGIIGTLEGKKQRYRCIECGKTFYDEEDKASESGIFHSNDKTKGLMQLNEQEKMLIDQLRFRMETHPDEPMLYKGIPYTPAQMIEEIKKGSSTGKGLVQEMMNKYWANSLEKLPMSGYKVKKKKLAYLY